MASNYQPRFLYFDGHLETLGWTLKWYDLRREDSGPLRELHTAARDVIESALRASVPSSLDTGLGFVVLHRGEEAVWLMLDTWAGDILTHLLWRAELGTPTQFQRVPTGGPMACVHELVVHNHERNAFVQHMLAPVGGPKPRAYLDSVCNGDPAHSERLLTDFDRAWRRGNVDSLMKLFAEDPVYAASAGPEPGRTFRGRDDVRLGLASVIADEATAEQPIGPERPLDVAASPRDDTWVTRWSYSVLAANGERREIRGVDLWTIHGWRIIKKDAYRKTD